MTDDPILDARTSPVARGVLAAYASPALAGADLAIHPHDEMLRFTAERVGDLDLALGEYVATGLHVARTVRSLADWRCGGLARAGRVLDFASGYGRVTRFLVREQTPERLTVTEINPEAVEFQRRRFGVDAVLSAVEPERLELADGFDLVIATSLFTHLPRDLFVRWLRRLTGLLAPRGLLAFSVHDLATSGRAEPADADGFLFLPVSESRVLDTGDYGSTWVSEAFVRAAVDQLGGCAAHRVERGVAGFQDLWLVAAAPGDELGSYRPPAEPIGNVDSCLGEGAAIELSGWALLPDGRPVDAVELQVDGEVVARAGEPTPRPDIAAIFPGGDTRSGWTLSALLPVVRDERSSLVVRVTGGGETTLLHFGSVASTRLAGARVELARRQRRLDERLEASAPTDSDQLAYAGEAHAVVDSVLRAVGVPRGFERSIHAHDEMLAHDLQRLGDRDLALAEYFRTGARIASSIRRLAAWRWGGLERARRILDFASGYGRVTRFLAPTLPPGSLAIAEINPEAVDFQAGLFGVEGLRSNVDPASFDVDEPYDLIVASSLFTHLPRAAFVPWLRRLHGFLAPGGLLAFSVHDLAKADPLLAAEATDGFLYKQNSESRTLRLEDYGSTWVAKEYVAAVIQDANWPMRRLPDGLCNCQDLYLVAADSETDFGSLDYESDPRARLEACQFRAGRLEVSGWATAPHSGQRLALIELHLAGRCVAERRSFDWRQDVADINGTESGWSGWLFDLTIPESAWSLSTPLVLRCVTERGHAVVAWAGTLGHALLAGAAGDLLLSRRELQGRKEAFEQADFRSRQLAHESAELADQIRAMRASRFWKARNAWFRLKTWRSPR